MMQKKLMRKERFTPDRVRDWGLENLMRTVEAPLDISRLVDPAYLATLSPMQAAKIKKVITDRNGVIVSVELVGTVEIIVAAANIAGTREAAKAAANKKAEEEEQKNTKRKGAALILHTTSKQPAEPPPEESGTPKKKKTSLSSVMDKISEKKAVKN